MSGEAFWGLPVIYLVPDSAADRAGVLVGDRVIFANGQRINSLSDYVEARGIKKDGLDLTVQRGLQILDLALEFPCSDEPGKIICPGSV